MMKERHIQRKGGIRRGIYILPNLCTTGSLFCGFYAVVEIFNSELVHAAWLILLAGLFDMFDGQLARLTHGGSQFGIEYDSLVDLASFGFAPSLLIYVWGLNDFHRLGWIISFLFFACGALRLARYNVQAEAEELRFFQGLPVPMAAYTLATLVIFHDHLFGLPAARNPWALVLTLVLALLMVSTVRYRNAKEFSIRKRSSFFVLVGTAVAIALIAWEPEQTMLALTLGYVASGPIEELLTLLIKGKRPIAQIHSKEDPLSLEGRGEG